LFAAALLLFVVGSLLAWWQPPRLFPLQPQTAADWLLQPLEDNAFQRMPRIFWLSSGSQAPLGNPALEALTSRSRSMTGSWSFPHRIPKRSLGTSETSANRSARFILRSFAKRHLAQDKSCTPDRH
jgi:hypothetical protein